MTTHDSSPRPPAPAAPPASDTTTTPHGTPTAPGTPHARRRAPRALRTELRRGVGPWAGAGTAVVVAVAMYGKADYVNGWQNRWTDATDLLRVAGVLLCGPLAVAAGCWQGGRERRRGTGAWRASLPGSPLRQTLLAAAPIALWPAVGYLIAAAGCLLATWPYVSGGAPHLELVAADAVVLASLGTVGFVLGRAIPWRFTAPLLAVVTYVGLAYPNYSEPPARWLNPANQHSYFLDRPVWWFGPVSMVWAGGLAAAVLLAYAARRRATALVPLTAACAAAVLIAQTGDGLWRPDPWAARPVCDDGTPQVCVSAVDRALLPAVSAALAPLNARLRGVPGAPTRWVDPNPAEGEAQLPPPAFDSVRGRLKDPVAYADSAVDHLFSESCEDADFQAPDWERALAVNNAVGAWLSPADGLGPILGPAELRHLARLEAKSPADQRAYLARYLSADRCDAAQVPVP
ncbi:hypothetical protein [Streptomyces sp. NPDC000410]|uniref:hypothetical protein n=1 Tax=Streptomyces sp. NPDC000410 TaxID=3154254 RepID=UPI00331ACC41